MVRAELSKLVEKYMEVLNMKCEDIKCMIRKAETMVKIRKKIDKLVYQLAFIYSSSSPDEKKAIEEVVDALINAGLLDTIRWNKALADTARWRSRLDGSRSI